MNAKHRTYRQQDAQAWLRIDMLIALYESGLRSVSRLIEAHEHGDFHQVPEHRSKVLRIILELLAGLDFAQGDLPHRVARLCEFMQHGLLTGGEDNYRAVLRVLTTLRDAFMGIRDEAARLETRGEIPAIKFSSSIKVTV